MKLGIVGSSYSCGKYPLLRDREKTTPPLEDFLKKYISDDIEIINIAQAGNGCEHYLRNITYLKKEHNIDAILFEIVQNRQLFNMPYSRMSKPQTVDEFQSTFFVSRGASNYFRYFTSGAPKDELITRSDCSKFRRLAEKLLVNHWTRQITISDLSQAIDLCNMLDIKTIGWQFNEYNYIVDNPSFEKEIKNKLTYYVDFAPYKCAKLHYINAYPDIRTSTILFDGAHFNNKFQNLLCKEFLGPAVNKVLTK